MATAGRKELKSNATCDCAPANLLGSRVEINEIADCTETKDDADATTTGFELALEDVPLTRTSFRREGSACIEFDTRSPPRSSEIRDLPHNEGIVLSEIDVSLGVPEEMCIAELVSSIKFSAGRKSMQLRLSAE